MGKQDLKIFPSLFSLSLTKNITEKYLPTIFDEKIETLTH